MVGRRKKSAFANLRDKIKSRISARSTRLLSIGGRQVFIKSILHSIPTFAMSCFLLPKTFCKELEAIFARFC